jgi:type VI secretion system protein ImpM
VFSAGIIDEHVWAGIMLPSVDKVGRYFPFSVSTMLPEYTNPIVFLKLKLMT